MEYITYQTVRDGEFIGNNITSKDSIDLVLYTITRFTPELVRSVGDDSLLDMALFSILSYDAVIGGRLILFDTAARLDNYPPETRDVWTRLLPLKYTVQLSIEGTPTTVPIGGADTQEAAYDNFNEWVDYFKPGHPIRIKVSEQRTLPIWLGTRGILTVHTIDEMPTSYQAASCKN